MKRLVLLACLVPMLAHAHIGSPDVFFEGHAGPHAVGVVIRPPAALPGLAQIDVRVADEISAVSLQAAPAEAGPESTPAPFEAKRVEGDAHLYHAELWLFRDGAYKVSVVVESAGGGKDTIILPLASAALRPPVMPPALGGGLAGLGVLLLLGAAALAGAAARDGTRAPGVDPTPRDRKRGRCVAGLALLLLGGSGYAVTLRWQKMDREFSDHSLARPVPVNASVRTEGGLRLLHLEPPLDRATSAGWDNVVTDHGKLAHCFLIAEPDARVFAHLHPVRCDAQTLESVLPSLPAGAYHFYGEITHANGRSDTLTARVDLPEPLAPAPQPAWNPADDAWCQTPRALAGTAPPPTALDPDDSWHLRGGAANTRVSPIDPTQRMVFQNASEFVENRPVTLRFAVFGTDGEALQIQPYMGMRGHAVIRRSDGEVFTHLHPAGTISMAAQELFEQRDRPNDKPFVPFAPQQTGREVTFPYAFPRAGDYRIWVQVRLAGRVATGVFDVKVQPAR